MSEQTPSTTASAAADHIPSFRYTAALANEIEGRWQDRWEAAGTFNAPNPTGLFAPTDGSPVPQDKFFLMDMFPYPSGAGLHVGHPLGYIGTDVLGRFLRMTGRNVLHTVGFDSFGLPAEQYAIRTGTHPAVTTEQNINRYREQLRKLGFGHDQRRSVASSDPKFFRWTQWIFLQLFNAWYDADAAEGALGPSMTWPVSSRPVCAPTPDGRPWAELTGAEQQQLSGRSPAGLHLAGTGQLVPGVWAPCCRTRKSRRTANPRSAISRSSGAICGSG